MLFLSLISHVDAREREDGTGRIIYQQRAFLEEKVYAFCDDGSRTDARGRKYTVTVPPDSLRCLEAKAALDAFNNKPRDGQYSDGRTRSVVDDSSFFDDKSIGGYVFKTFYSGLKRWIKGSGSEQGVFERFSATVTPFLEKTMTLLIILLSVSAFFNKFTQHIEKGIKAFMAFVLVIAFLEWRTFEYWIFDPLLGLMVGTMKVLFNAESSGLTDAIFGVDVHFTQLFNAVENYDKLLEEKGAFFDFQIFKQIVAYLIVGMFGALYAIFTILIIVGFFGFILLLGFAPVFMAIGIFNKGIFLSWAKASMNYFLIPIFTAAVMSVTVSFIVSAADAIGRLSPEDSIFIKDVGFVFLVGIFSIGLHWKAPEFAAGITGGMASGAGSIVGTAAAVAGGAWALSKSPIGGTRNFSNAISGMRGGGVLGNEMSGSYKAGKMGQELWGRLRSGGIK